VVTTIGVAPDSADEVTSPIDLRVAAGEDLLGEDAIGPCLPHAALLHWGVDTTRPLELLLSDHYRSKIALLRGYPVVRRWGLSASWG
jgi:hypothetical protein